MSSLIITRTLPRQLTVQFNRSLRPTSIANYTGYSSRHENDPQKLDDHKKEALAEQKKGQGQWREELASDAEAFIKAERQEIKATDESIKRLQNETNELLAKRGAKGN